MRNFLLSILVISLSFSLSSCLNSDSSPVKNTDIAIRTEDVVRNTNLMALDPAAVAFRLNTLLTEASRESNEGLELNEIMVEIEGENFKLQNILFGDSEIRLINEEEGTYLITYLAEVNDHPHASQDIIRRGKIVVETGGLLLTDLALRQGSWDVYTAGSDNYLYYFSRYVGQGFNIEMPEYEKQSEKTYSIKGFARDSWMINVKKITAYYVEKNTPSDWSVNFLLKYLPTPPKEGSESSDVDDLLSGKLYYNSVTNCEFEISGGAKGVPVFLDASLPWDIELDMSINSASPLEVRAYCNFTNSYFGGQVDIEYLTEELDEKVFPSKYITIRWSEAEGGQECRNKFKLWYNGYVFDTQYSGEFEDSNRVGI